MQTTNTKYNNQQSQTTPTKTTKYNQETKQVKQ